MQLHAPLFWKVPMSRKFFILCLLALTACAPRTTPFEPLISGLEVEVFVGPMCPVMQEGVECPDQPYQATLTVLRPNGEEYEKFETYEDGTYLINLPAGEYILRPETPTDSPLPYASEQNFTILQDEITHIVVNYDSGIR